MNEYFILSYFFIFIGILEMVFSIPLIYMKIPPNRIYGFRTRETLNNEELWYKANRYGGRDLLIAGILVSIGGLLILLLNMDFFNGLWMMLWFIIIPLIVVTMRNYLFIRREIKLSK